MIRAAVSIALVLTCAPLAHAQAPADGLTACLADNTTGRDRKDLATWIFLAMAAHPDIKQYVGSGASAAANESARTMGALVTRLLTDACAAQARLVFKEKQSESFKLAFERLGALAMQELMTDPSVNQTMGAFANYLDQARFAKLAESGK